MSIETESQPDRLDRATLLLNEAYGLIVQEAGQEYLTGKGAPSKRLGALAIAQAMIGQVKRVIEPYTGESRQIAKRMSDLGDRMREQITRTSDPLPADQPQAG